MAKRYIVAVTKEQRGTGRNEREIAEIHRTDNPERIYRKMLREYWPSNGGTYTTRPAAYIIDTETGSAYNDLDGYHYNYPIQTYEIDKVLIDWMSENGITL